jgi:hypothetical protein
MPYLASNPLYFALLPSPPPLPLPCYRYVLLPGEVALSMKTVQTFDNGPGPNAEVVTLLAVGTGSSYGEDYPCVGRLLLFSISTTSRLRLEGGEEVLLAPRLAVHHEFSHGGVTCVDSLKNYLVLAVGHTVELHYKSVRCLSLRTALGW